MRVRVSAYPLIMPNFGIMSMQRESGRSLGVYSLGFRVRGFGFYDFSRPSRVRARTKKIGFRVSGVWVSGVEFRIGIWF